VTGVDGRYRRPRRAVDAAEGVTDVDAQERLSPWMPPLTQTPEPPPDGRSRYKANHGPVRDLSCHAHRRLTPIRENQRYDHHIAT
jgi:hypothetical protein